MFEYNLVAEKKDAQFLLLLQRNLCISLEYHCACQIPKVSQFKLWEKMYSSLLCLHHNLYKWNWPHSGKDL